MSKKYIHYGSDKFDINKFNSIKNRSFIKPEGGLWSSPVNAPNYSWYDWCLDNDFYTEQLKKSFIFTIKPTSKIITIDTNDKRKAFTNNKDLYYSDRSGVFENINFQHLVELGYDGLEIFIFSEEVYFSFYGWDVDSLLVFNPDIIIPIEETT